MTAATLNHTPVPSAPPSAPAVASHLDTDKFWALVLKTDDCWLWAGMRDRNGYGKFYDGGHHNAHRVAYELLVGPIPEGLTIDHVCRRTWCVNPAHMEPVTAAENVRRANSHRVRPAKCKRGHEYTPENTRWATGGGRTKPSRRCLDCERVREANRSPRRHTGGAGRDASIPKS